MKHEGCLQKIKKMQQLSKFVNFSMGGQTFGGHQKSVKGVSIREATKYAKTCFFQEPQNLLWTSKICSKGGMSIVNNNQLH